MVIMRMVKRLEKRLTMAMEMRERNWRKHE